MEGHVEGTSWEETSQIPSITSSFSRLPSRSELLASLPSKPATDKLLARFFNVSDPVIPALRKIIYLVFLRTDRHTANLGHRDNTPAYFHERGLNPVALVSFDYANP